jgi:hypothetical protein
MRRGIASILAVALVVSLGLAAGLHAQATKDEKTKLDRLEGYVLGIDKTKSEITIRQRKTTNMQWTVVYTPETKFTYRNAEATLDTVKEGLRVICEGSFGAEKTKLNAVRIDVRTDK